MIDDIHQVSKNPTKAQLANICETMSNLYPQSFQDRLCNDLVGSGYSYLLNRLCDRRDNANRHCHTLAKRRIVQPTEKVPKKRLKDSYGCVSWQPELPEDCSELSNLQESLKMHSSNGTLLATLDEVLNSMKQLIAT